MQSKINGQWLNHVSLTMKRVQMDPLESDLLLSRDGNHWWDDIH